MSGPQGPSGKTASLSIEDAALTRPTRVAPRFSHRLTRPWMYKAVLEKGKSMKSPPLSLRYLQSTEPVDTFRMGFIVRKKTGNAVMRNSIRRVLREAFLARLPRMSALPSPAWMVFDVLPQASSLSKRTLRLKGEELLERFIKQFEIPAAQS